MRSTRWLLLLAVAGTKVASAQPAGAQAEVLFRQGKDLLAKGQIAEACDAFDASQKLDPTPATLLNQANCREKNAQYATAWGLFLEAERNTRAAVDAPGKAAHAAAVDRAAKLEARLSTLTIVVGKDARLPGLEIQRNGQPVSSAEWGRALPIDGGTYKIVARAPGAPDWTGEIAVANERGAATIEVPRLGSAEPNATPTPATPAPIVAPPPRAEAPPRRSRAAPIALGAGAIALGGAAVAFALWGNSIYDDAKVAPTDEERTSGWHSANQKRYAAEALGAAGIVAGGVAMWLFLRGGERESATQTVLAPYLDATGAGLAVGGGF